MLASETASRGPSVRFNPESLGVGGPPSSGTSERPFLQAHTSDENVALVSALMPVLTQSRTSPRLSAPLLTVTTTRSGEPPVARQSSRSGARGSAENATNAYVVRSNVSTMKGEIARTLGTTEDDLCARVTTPEGKQQVKEAIAAKSKALIEQRMQARYTELKQAYENAPALRENETLDALLKLEEKQLKMKLVDSTNADMKICDIPLKVTSAKDTGSVSTFSLQARQDLAFHRFVQFSNKKGMLFMHSVGTGKTVTSLSIALNSFLWNDTETSLPAERSDDTETGAGGARMRKRKIVLVIPGSLFGNFESELKEKIPNIDKGSFDKLDFKKDGPERFSEIEKIVPPIAKVMTKFNNLNFTMIGYKYGDIAKALGDISKKDNVKNIFRNAVVIFDEAHRLFRPFMTHDNKLEPMLDRFKNEQMLADTKRFLLMTGTPYSVGIEDTVKFLEMIDRANTGAGRNKGSEFELLKFEPEPLSFLGYNLGDPKKARNDALLKKMSFAMKAYLAFLDFVPRQLDIQDLVQPELKKVRPSWSQDWYNQAYKKMVQLRRENKKFFWGLMEEKFAANFGYFQDIYDFDNYFDVQRNAQRRKALNEKWAKEAYFEYTGEYLAEIAEKPVKVVAQVYLMKAVLYYLLNLLGYIAAKGKDFLPSMPEALSGVATWIASQGSYIASIVSEYIPSFVSGTVNYVWSWVQSEPKAAFIVTAIALLWVTKPILQKFIANVMRLLGKAPFMQRLVEFRVKKILEAGSEEEAARLAHSAMPTPEEAAIIMAQEQLEGRITPNNVSLSLLPQGGGGTKVARRLYTAALNAVGAEANTPFPELQAKLNALRTELEENNNATSENQAQLQSTISILEGVKDGSLELVDDDLEDESGLKYNIGISVVSSFKKEEDWRRFFRIARHLTLSDEFEEYSKYDSEADEKMGKFFSKENISATSDYFLRDIREELESIPEGKDDEYIDAMMSYMKSTHVQTKSLLLESMDEALEESKLNSNTLKNIVNANAKIFQGGANEGFIDSDPTVEMSEEGDEDEEDEEDEDIKDLSSKELSDVGKIFDTLFEKTFISQIEALETAEQVKKAGGSEELANYIISDILVATGTVSQEEAVKEVVLNNSQTGGAVGDIQLKQIGAVLLGKPVEFAGRLLRVPLDIASFALVKPVYALLWKVQGTPASVLLQNAADIRNSEPLNYVKFANKSLDLISNFDIEMNDIDVRYTSAMVEKNGKAYKFPAVADLRLKEIGEFFNVKDEYRQQESYAGSTRVATGRKRMEKIEGTKLYKGINYNKTLYRYPLKEVKFIYIPYSVDQQFFGAEVFYKDITSKQRWWNNIENLKSKAIRPEEDYRNALRRSVGNYSKECETYRPIFMSDSLLGSPYNPHYTIRDIENKEDITVETNPEFANATFACPKFDKILEHLLLMKTGIMMTGNGFEPQPHLRKFEKVTKAGLEVGFGDDLYDLQYNPDFVNPIEFGEATHYYLPLVYSTSDTFGLNLFATYLEKKGFKYILLHDLFPQSITEREQQRALKKVYKLVTGGDAPGTTGPRKEMMQKLKEIMFTNDTTTYADKMNALLQTIDKSEPICILLHPDITEGVDAKHNPAIFLMEPPNTFNDYEQLCGRVLRTYSRGYATRPKKMVYQFACFNKATIDQKVSLAGERAGPLGEELRQEGQAPFFDDMGVLKDDIFEGLQRYQAELQTYMPIGAKGSLWNRFVRALWEKFSGSKEVNYGKLTEENKRKIRDDFNRFVKMPIAQQIKQLLEDAFFKDEVKVFDESQLIQQLQKLVDELPSNKPGTIRKIFEFIPSVSKALIGMLFERYLDGTTDSKIAEQNRKNYIGFLQMKRIVDDLISVGAVELPQQPGTVAPTNPVTKDFDRIESDFRKGLATINSYKSSAQKEGKSFKDYIKQDPARQRKYEDALKDVQKGLQYFKDFYKGILTEESPDMAQIQAIAQYEYPIRKYLQVLREDVNPDLHKIYDELTDPTVNKLGFAETINWCQPFAPFDTWNKAIICRPISSVTNVVVNNQADTSIVAAQDRLTLEQLLQVYKKLINGYAQPKPNRKPYEDFSLCELSKVDDIRELFFMKMKPKINITFGENKQVDYQNEGNEDERTNQCFDENGVEKNYTTDTYFSNAFASMARRPAGGGKKVYKTRKQVESKKRKTRRHR